MDGIKFIHHSAISILYTGYKVHFDDRDIYIIAWQGDRFIETVTYEVDEFESKFEKGIWVKIVD